MGLDQYAFSRPAGTTNTIDWEKDKELYYWRKHPNLQGWMERLWRKRQYGDPDKPDPCTGEGYQAQSYMQDPFNDTVVELKAEDIQRLRLDIKNQTLNGGYGDASGFFWGDPSDEYYRENDIEFCDKAEEELKRGMRIMYYCSW